MLPKTLYTLFIPFLFSILVAILALAPFPHKVTIGIFFGILSSSSSISPTYMFFACLIWPSFNSGGLLTSIKKRSSFLSNLLFKVSTVIVPMVSIGK